MDRSTSWWPAVLFTRWRSPAAGHAWTCGNNSYSQLGVGDSTDRLVFTQVDAGQLGGARIVMAACGALHSVVVAAEGHVRTSGCGDYGCLGHNDEQDRLVPTVAPVAPAKFEVSKSEGSKPYCKTQEQVLLHTQT